MAGLTIRPMVADDIVGAEATWHAAINGMRAASGQPVEERTDDSTRQTQGRIGYLLGTDPDGSWVAVDGAGEVVGLAQALVREDVWVLSKLGVAPGGQTQGTGKALLDAALGYGTDVGVGLIFCSRDPRAMRRYTRAGFDLNPSMSASGPVDRRLARDADVRQGTGDDLELVATLDRLARGGSRRPEVDVLLGEGCQLWVLDGRGYAVMDGAKLQVLAADDEKSAVALLRTCLAESPGNEPAELKWMTAGQQWAIHVALEAGLVLQPSGPVMTRGMSGTPPWSLPSGAFG